MAPLFIVLAASGRHLFSILYSKSYAVSGDVFLILVPAIFLLSLAVYLNAVVHAISTVKKHSMAFFLLALNIALNLLLIPKFGSIGTGVSLLIPSMLGCFMYAMPAQSALAAKLDLKQLSKRICLLVIMAVISNLVYRYLAFSNIYSLCVSYALLLSFCIVMMKILGLFVGKDILGYLRSSPNKSSL
jgi:O-antigen/teichoic acid export membrane protein